ncbi:Uncharacterized protein TCM_009170 [Theobroma cacao]|uniref:Uncharacterized protein n=1 Tax=Theobroma cacao TaxID=3641 RepID=A0A061ECG7_THECC|nr:Uncharacterized protein TCM_009170 [Theobroma cacao]
MQPKALVDSGIMQRMQLHQSQAAGASSSTPPRPSSRIRQATLPQRMNRLERRIGNMEQMLHAIAKHMGMDMANFPPPTEDTTDDKDGEKDSESF